MSLEERLSSVVFFLNRFNPRKSTIVFITCSPCKQTKQVLIYLKSNSEGYKSQLFAKSEPFIVSLLKGLKILVNLDLLFCAARKFDLPSQSVWVRTADRQFDAQSRH